jgi:hypothetical protein
VFELQHFDPSANKNALAPTNYMKLRTKAAHPKRWVLADKQGYRTKQNEEINTFLSSLLSPLYTASTATLPSQQKLVIPVATFCLFFWCTSIVNGRIL